MDSSLECLTKSGSRSAAAPPRVETGGYQWLSLPGQRAPATKPLSEGQPFLAPGLDPGRRADFDGVLILGLRDRGLIHGETAPGFRDRAAGLHDRAPGRGERPPVSMTEGRVVVKRPPVSMTERRVVVTQPPVSMTEGRTW